MQYSTPKMRSLVWSVLVGLVLVAMLLGVRQTSANKSRASMSQLAQVEWATKGKFDAPIYFPLDSPVMIHASVLPNGRILFWGRDKVVQNGSATIYDEVGHSKARLWDPQTGVIEVVDNGSTNLFCSGHSLLPDGRLFVTGGHNHWHPNSLSGDQHTNIFDPVTKTWAAQGPSGPPLMEKGRWYPFNVTLDTGEVAILAGTYQRPTQPIPNPTPPAVDTQKNPEIYNPSTNTLELMNPSAVGLPTYPYVFLDPVSGDNTSTGLTRGVFIAGPRSSYYWNPRGGDGKGSWSSLGLQNSLHLDGSAVMYDSDQGSILMVGGRGNSSTATTTAQKITLNQANPQWQLAAPMNYPRSRHTATMLPDGKVLVSGGVPCWSGYEDTPCHINNPKFDQSTYDVNITREAEMWDPSTGQWQLVAKAEKTRGYHSVALLLPDARVLVGGYGNPDGLRVPPDPDPYPPGQPENPDAWLNLRRHTTGERNVELYSPPYLFDAGGNPKPRPGITSVASEVFYGQQFGLSYGNATGISRVAWIRLPSVTHGFNQDQRINVLQYQSTPGLANQLTVMAPADPRKCPPGYYMLFIFDQTNTPSVAKIVRIRELSTTSPEIGARAALDASGRMHVFYRHLQDTQLRYIQQTTAGVDSWSQPVTLGGYLTTNPVAVADSQKRLWVFVGGSDNAIYINRQTDSGWTGFYRIGGAISSSLAVARNIDGRIQVFYRGTDNALWYIRQTVPGLDQWETPVTLGGWLASEPVVAMNADGKAELFVVGSDSALYAARQSAPASTAWAPFYRIGGYLTSIAAVGRNADGRLQVFVRGSDNLSIYHARQTVPGSATWDNFQLIGGQSAGAASVATNIDGSLQVFIRWQSDNSLRTAWQTTPGGSFTSSWMNLGGALSPSQLNSPVLGVGGHLYTFVRGAAFDLFVNRQALPSSKDTWVGYTALGDSAHSF